MSRERRPWSRLRKWSLVNVAGWLGIGIVTWWIGSVIAYSDYDARGVEWALLVETGGAIVTSVLLGVRAIRVRRGHVGSPEELYAPSSFLPDSVMTIDGVIFIGMGVLLVGLSAQLGFPNRPTAIAAFVIGMGGMAAWGASLIAIDAVSAPQGVGER